MPRYFESWERSQYSFPTPTVEESDAMEKARIAAKRKTPATTGLAALEKLQNELSTLISESKTRSVKATADIAESQMDMGTAIEAQIQAKEFAEKIAEETGSTITPTGKVVPNPNLLKPKVDGDGGSSGDGGNKNVQFVEYEYDKNFTKRRAKFFNPATGQFTYGEWENNPMTPEDYKAQQDAAAEAARLQQQKADAFALIEATMRSYGFNETELAEITKFIQEGLINPQMGPNQLALALRQLPSYKSRFAGNEERRARGLNTLSEGDYLQQEQDYSATLRQRGLQRFAVREQYAKLIGNDISNVELGKRADIAIQRVQNGDPLVLQQLRSYYNITEQDIAAYYLSPKEVLPELEARTVTAEIGSVASRFGLAAERQRAENLRMAGVDLARARAGYELISERLPRSQELSQIYAPSGIEFTQTTAEEEEFKGTASAKRARERLKELETGSFTGTSGRGLLAVKGAAGAI